MSSRVNSSSTCTPLTPTFSTSSVNTPGSDSMVHHSDDACIIIIIFISVILPPGFLHSPPLRMQALLLPVVAHLLRYPKHEAPHKAEAVAHDKAAVA